MTSTLAPTPLASPRGSTRPLPTSVARAAALTLGGVVSAAGHLLHPMDHEAASRSVDRFELVHWLFIAGAFLLLAGLPLVRDRLGGDRYAAIVVGAASFSTMLIAPLVALEAFASAHVDQRTFDEIAASTGGAGAVAMITMVLGMGGIGVLAWRRGLGHRLLAAGLVASSAILLLVPALPGPDGIWAIAGLGSMNLALAALGCSSTSQRG